MTPTEQEMYMAVLEWMGWTHPTRAECTRDPVHKWRSPVDGCCYDEPPPLTLDWLWACREKLSRGQRYKYLEILDSVVPLVDEDQNASYTDWHLIQVTKEQHLEAITRIVAPQIFK